VIASDEELSRGAAAPPSWVQLGGGGGGGDESRTIDGSAGGPDLMCAYPFMWLDR
jgi:hypothetical protein